MHSVFSVGNMNMFVIIYCIGRCSGNYLSPVSLF